jgi:hypothetical protein
MRVNILGCRVVGPDSLDPNLYTYLLNDFVKCEAGCYLLCGIVLSFRDIACLAISIRGEEQICWKESSGPRSP